MTGGGRSRYVPPRYVITEEASRHTRQWIWIEETKKTFAGYNWWVNQSSFFFCMLFKIHFEQLQLSPTNLVWVGKTYHIRPSPYLLTQVLSSFYQFVVTLN